MSNSPPNLPGPDADLRDCLPDVLGLLALPSMWRTKARHEILRTFVEAHGSKVSAQSAGVGRGSVFSIELPLSDATATASAAPPPSAVIRSNLERVARVMIVDDNEDAAAMLGAALEHAGFSVRVETDPLSALAAIEQFEPDVGILDIGMPRLDGHQLCEQIRSQFPARLLPLVALTGYGQAADRDRAILAGFTAHCTKPIQFDTLVELLESLLRTSIGSAARPKELPGYD